MNFRFPLDDVRIGIVSARREVLAPSYSDDYYILNQHEFSMDVPGVAFFCASRGREVSIVPYPDADTASIELYLNGSVYGAVLHQRKILPLHGSSFRYRGQS